MKKAPDMNLKRVLAERIQAIRIEHGLSQQKFADSISVSRVHLNRMEAPEIEMMPSKQVLKKLCNTYNVNWDWLMTGEGEIYIKSEEKPTPSVEEPEISLSIIRNTEEFIVLKSNALIRHVNMSKANFFKYFKLFSTLINTLFRLMDELKNLYENEKPISNEIYDAYSCEFVKILEEQKN